MINSWRPLFPLNLVVYPGEKLNLHIFEPRYKQLINDCLKADRRFGIPSYIDKKIEFGTEVMITEIVKVYEDGRMDVKTKGIRIFKVDQYENPYEEKLYACGTLDFPENEMEGDEQYQEKIIDLINNLYKILKLKIRLSPDSFQDCYSIAHKIGFSTKQEYELLKIKEEKLRQIFIIDHLERTIPMMRDMERTKEIIKMNGHFKNFNPIDF